MRTRRGVHARFGQAQTLDRPLLRYMFPDDLSDILRLHEAVPDRLRINHNRRPMLALIRTARLVGADRLLEELCNSPLPSGEQQPRALPGSRWLVQMNRCLSKLANVPLLSPDYGKMRGGFSSGIVCSLPPHLREWGSE